jgi:two-component system sensor histidine kinase YesM
MIIKHRNRVKKINGKWFQRITLLTSMGSMLTYTVIIVFIATLGMGYLVHNYVAKVNREFDDIYSDSANLYISEVEDKLSSYITAMEVVSMSKYLRDNIFKSNISRSEMVILSNHLRQWINETTFYLYQAKEVISHKLYTNLPADGNYFADIKKEWEEDWFSTLKQESPQCSYKYSNVTHTNHLILAGLIYNYNSAISKWGQEYCGQTITVDTSTLFKPYASYGTMVYIIDNKTGNIVYNCSSLLQKKEKDTIHNQFYEIYKNISKVAGVPAKVVLTDGEGNSERYTVMTRNIDLIDGTAVMLFNPNQIGEEGGTGVIYGTVILLLLMMLLLILSNWVYNKRLNLLIVRMDKIKEKDALLPEPMGGMDELARIDKHLLQMQRRIHTLIQEEYTAKMQVMTAQQEALIACINPHFLYNTLNTISAMANMEGAESATEMISALSTMFRYSSNVSKQHVVLRDEIENISVYLYIQSIRYQDAFTYCMEIPDSLYEYHVPKLILQPLIENTFKHGFNNHLTERDGDKQIHVSAEKLEEDLIITVQDNGKGISVEKLSIIKEQIANPEFNTDASVSDNGSIGLLNVHNRIRLWYGSAYGLQIASEGVGKGAVVTVHMPCC